jgi:hypothetical protein
LPKLFRKGVTKNCLGHRIASIAKQSKVARLLQILDLLALSGTLAISSGAGLCGVQFLAIVAAL